MDANDVVIMITGVLAIFGFGMVKVVFDVFQAQKANDRLRKIEEDSRAITPENLTRIYRAQLETYQTQTLRRASWSFTVAIIAMIAGLAFVWWGGIRSSTVQAGSM